MEPGSILLGIAAILSALSAIFANINKKKQNKIAELFKAISDLKDDVGIIKKACFFSLKAHVEQGANGDVKKTYEEMRDTVFKE